MFYSLLYTLPSPGEFLASIGAWANPFFMELLPFALFTVGIGIACLIVNAVIEKITGAVQMFRNKKE